MAYKQPGLDQSAIDVPPHKTPGQGQRTVGVPQSEFIPLSSRLGESTASDKPRRPPIRRRYSCRLPPSGYTLNWCLTDPLAKDASNKRTALMRDWIDNHDFSESSSEAVKLVHWKQIPPYERFLAVHHAKRRALAALSEYKCQLKESPRPRSQDSDSLDLDAFVDEDSGGDVEGRIVLSNFPDWQDLDLGDFSRLPRTIVLFAKVYQQLLVLKEEAAQDAAHWILFLAWLYSPHCNGYKLREMCISDRIAKEGAIYMRKCIRSLVKKHNSIRDRMVEKCGDDVAIRPITNLKDLYPGPQWQVTPADICSASPGFIRKLKFLSGSKKDYVSSSKKKLSYLKKLTKLLLKQEEPAAFRDEFWCALDTRALTLHELLPKLDKLKAKAAELGVDLSTDSKEKSEGNDIIIED